LSWVTDFWKLLETIATLTKEAERANSEIKELRRDVNALTHTVIQLRVTLHTKKKLPDWFSTITRMMENISRKVSTVDLTFS
jgi:hypothetical protein